jgi:hypothetical protein
MTLSAAKLLDEAISTHMAVASNNDQDICTQTPNWLPPVTPYDYSVLFIKSLIPLTYNFDQNNVALTNLVWDEIASMGEAPPIDYVLNTLAKSIERHPAGKHRPTSK